MTIEPEVTKTMTTADVQALIEKVVGRCDTCGFELTDDGRTHVCQIWE